MGQKYIAGRSVIRLPGRPAIIPGERFETDAWTAEQEALALASGAIQLQPGQTSLLEQAARQAEAEAAAEAAARETAAQEASAARDRLARPAPAGTPPTQAAMTPRRRRDTSPSSPAAPAGAASTEEKE